MLPVIQTVVVCPASEGPLQRTPSAPAAFQRDFTIEPRRVESRHGGILRY